VTAAQVLKCIFFKSTRLSAGDARHKFKNCNWLGLNCWTTWVDFYPTEVMNWDKSTFGNMMKYT